MSEMTSKKYMNIPMEENYTAVQTARKWQKKLPVRRKSPACP